MAETSYEVSAIFCIYLNKKAIRIQWQSNTYSLANEYVFIFEVN